jgi:hypothetical protein
MASDATTRKKYVVPDVRPLTVAVVTLVVATEMNGPLADCDWSTE